MHACFQSSFRRLVVCVCEVVIFVYCVLCVVLCWYVIGLLSRVRWMTTKTVAGASGIGGPKKDNTNMHNKNEKHRKDTPTMRVVLSASHHTHWRVVSARWLLCFCDDEWWVKKGPKDRLT